MATEKSQVFVYEDMIRELNARKNGLLQEKGVLSRAQARIAEIDDAVALIDVEISAYEQKAAPSRKLAADRAKAAEEAVAREKSADVAVTKKP